MTLCTGFLLSLSFRIFLLLTSHVFTSVHSDMSPNPNPYFVTNKNGVSQGPIYLKGGLKYAWEEDEQGFTVLSDVNNTRSYYYATLNATTGDLVMTNYPIRKKVNGTLVGSSPSSLLGIPSHVQPSESVKLKKCGDFCKKNDQSNSNRNMGHSAKRRNLVSTTGTLKNLIVLFKFSDHATRTLPSVADITTLMNHPGNGVNVPFDPKAPTGSVREHYLKSSYGQLQIDSVVANWVTIDYTESYCADSNSGRTPVIHTCLRNALSKVDAQINFTQFDVDGNRWIDAIGFLHSGYGAEWGGAGSIKRIWSHKWALINTNLGGIWTSAEGVSVYEYHISPSIWGTSGSAIGRIGVIAHETGHFLGLPDLYDTDGGGSGLGSWSLMANSWGFTNDQYYPPPMDAWCKITLGWVTPTVISPSLTPISLAPQCQSSTIYKITTNFPTGEYLLIENRQKVCLYDSKMSGSFSGGLAIFHIDENQPSFNRQGYPGQSGWPGNYNHYRVALLQADKLYELEQNGNRGNIGDLYRDGDTLGPSTSSTGPYPNSDSYAYGIGVKKTGIIISNIATSGNNITFSLTDSSSTRKPTIKPSLIPSISLRPSNMPTAKPSPTKPTGRPSRMPSISLRPSQNPTVKPSPTKPTGQPSRMPSISLKPTRNPTAKPSPRKPTGKPSRVPSISLRPSRKPTAKPTLRKPTGKPTRKPTVKPSRVPSLRRSMNPTKKPVLRAPSRRPSARLSTRRKPNGRPF